MKTDEDRPRENRVISALHEVCAPVDACLSRIFNIDMHAELSGEKDLEDEQRRAELEEEIQARLEALSTRLAISLEMLGLRDTRSWFLSKWAVFDKKALGTVEFVRGEMDDVRSAPYDLISLVLSTLSAPSDFSDKSIRTTAQTEILENVLRGTAKIVSARAEERKLVIDREKPVRDIMHEYLVNVFPDYSPDEKGAKVLKPVKSFIPDAVIHSLRAAIEYKFVDSAAELKTALEGILADVSGYAGSHWQHYYSVIYMTGPYETEARFSKAVELTGNGRWWTQILVNGVGGRSKRAGKEPHTLTPAAPATKTPPIQQDDEPKVDVSNEATG